MSSADQSFVEVSSTGTALLKSVVGELEDETGASAILDTLDAVPGIDRRESETSALILTSNNPVNGYTCFLSLSDRVQREKGEFFLQPHTTEVVWGGRKVVFIFQHHSGVSACTTISFVLHSSEQRPGEVPGSHRLFSRKAARLFQSRRDCKGFPAERRREKALGSTLRYSLSRRTGQSGFVDAGELMGFKELQSRVTGPLPSSPQDSLSQYWIRKPLNAPLSRLA